MQPNPNTHSPIKVLFKNPTTQTWQEATSNSCLHSILGDRINLQWVPKQGILRIEKSSTQANKKQYFIKEDGVEIINGAYFQHGERCPLLRGDLEKNQKSMKACACVMLYNKSKKEFLVTERANTLRTYPCAWVLPGGHLESGEGIFEGGIRECCEEVGLPLDKQASNPIKQNCIMVWESAFVAENSIKASAIVVFFVAQCKEFDVKTDPKEVSAFKWKNIEDQSDQVRYSSKTKQGYAEGHLKYLSIVRKSHL